MQCWLVERTYDDSGLLRLVYATPDGKNRYVTERAVDHIDGVKAAIEIEAERLAAVTDSAVQSRYVNEVERVRERHDPDDRL